nr:lamin tail domain-containing protein [Bacteroidales bacterium]
KEYFASRLSAQMFTSFNEQRMLELIDEHAQTIEMEIPMHIQRWKGTTSSYGNAMPSESYWRNHVCKIKTFVKARPTALLSDLQNYGFSGIAQLTLSSYPAAAGNIKIDGLKVPESFCSSPYLKDIPIQITAENKPGYTFDGWYDLQQNWILNYGASWKYLDTGVNMDSEWRKLYYDDANWKNGPAELGYGDDDEATVLSYGGSSSSKYITSYFRKKIPVSESQIQDGEFFIHLLVDDGAVVYINGAEVIRQNLDCGTVNYQTLAYKTVSGDAEESLTSYCFNKELLVAGENQLAVEVHQVDKSSSDLSFNLGVSYFSSKEKTLYSLDNKTGFILTSDRYLSAIYSTENTCMVPSLITDEVTLSIDCSPYMVNEDIIIASSGILNIDPGVEIWMPEDGNIFVKGQLNSMGTENSPVSFRINPQYNSGNWGGIVFSNTNQISTLQYTIIEDASNGPNPLLENAAISCFNANLNMDYLTIEKVAGNPIIARYSDITLSNSTLHSEISGDLINVKYGNAEITNCRFTGNEQVDTDAIDFDEVENGVIRNSIITGFYGFNSDDIDLGEDASGILIDSIVVYNITDKGVSLGQHSSASIKNSVFINCNMGIGVKDSSNVIVENCLFYNNGNAIACFEKNIGLAGGNAYVKNSILSNSYLDSYFADLESKLAITYSLSDNLSLPDGYNNVNANPLFTGPSIYNFSLLAESPAIQSGNNSLGAVDMATLPLTNDLQPPVMISKFFINANAIQSPEFITLYNPSEDKIDVSGYSINRGVTVTIPQNIFIFPKSSIYITDNANDIFWEGRKTPIIQWTSGQLSNNGEAIQLSDSHGIVIDLLDYSIETGWPLNGFINEEAFVLEHTELDNHFPQNWTSVKLADALSSKAHSVESDIHVYPNPSAGIIHIKTENTQQSELFIYDYTGVLRGKWDINNSGITTLDISAYGPGVYILKNSAFTKRIILF